jgi:hypothetical protein
MTDTSRIERMFARFTELAGSEAVSRGSRRVFGPVPGAREFRNVCVIIVCVVALAGITSVVQSHAGYFGSAFGGDFPAFYMAGRILNDYPADRLYDLSLQSTLYHALQPDKSGMLGFFNAPYIALVFRPLALLPLQWAFLAWTLLSTGLYLAGIRLVCPKAEDLSRSTIFLGGIAFYPFVMESILGGQISTIAFFLFAVATRLLQKRPALAGMVLAGCLYKPTLLIFVLPVMLLARRWRMLFGFAAGTVVLVGLCTIFVGRASVREYIDVLLFYARMSSQPKDAFRVWMRLVDAVHFLSNFMPRRAALGVFAVCAAVIGWVTARAWRGRRPETAWAAIVALSVVLSIHTMSYDSVLVVLAGLVGYGTIQPGAYRVAHVRICGLIWCLGWFAWPVSGFIGINLFTPAILALGVILLAAANLPKKEQQPVCIAGHGTAEWPKAAAPGLMQAGAET